MKSRIIGMHLLLAFSLFLLRVTPACAQIAIDATAFADQGTAKSTVATAALSTSSSRELLLAFVSADYLSGTNTTVTSISGAGLVWVLIKRTNVQSGTAEIWRTFAPSRISNVTVTASLSQSVASSMTVMAFTGVDASGTNGSGAIGAIGTGDSNRGAPTATLTTTRSGSLVLGVGNDYDNAIARTPGPNQSLGHQYFSPNGDTYWVQRQNNATPLSGTAVTINDAAPTADRYNLSLCEVLVAPAAGSYSLLGKISPSSAGSGAILTLSGAAGATVTADSSGNYSFNSLANGAYTVTPSKPGYTFSPGSPTVTISGKSVSGVNFTATSVRNGSISGTISPTANGAGTLLSLSGTSSATVTADRSGNYIVRNLANGTYTVTPSKTGYTFTPGSQTVSINGTNVTGVSFTATAVSSGTISGTISPSSSGSGAILILTETPGGYATADSFGNYSFTNLPAGTYTVTPSKTGCTFSPPNLTITLNGASSTGNNFLEQALSPPALNYPDLSDLIPPGQISVVKTGSTRQLQYTHDTFDGGIGPLEIQPVYNSASGNYQGYQHVYSLDSSGNWTLARSIPVAGAFVFDADHGHFHFPFAGYGLYTANADGSIGSLVAASTKVGFCIADSFIYDPYLPNAGAFGNWGSCSDPTSLRGLSIGAVDEYDQTDTGQSISLAGVPDGTYWLRAIVDPNNYLAESDKSNNETDIKLDISGDTAQVLEIVKPVLPSPPGISQTFPANGATLSGPVQLRASTPVTGGSVQFLVDGLPFGSVVKAPPYAVLWDTTKVLNGAHWLAAQVTDSTGRIGTSAVVSVTVKNVNTQPPTVQVTSPGAGSTVSATVTVAAAAAAQTGVPTVQFYVDGTALGLPVTGPSYSAFWDTETTGAGTHVLTASAVDSNGLTGNSAPVSVTVDNSHPANVIGIDVAVFNDGGGTMTTSRFSTSKSADLLVAFVAYDGPATSQQTATVSGAGLNWTLLKRSNFQAGTAEIWAAKATDFLSNATVISQPGTGTSYHGSLTVIAFTNASGPGIVGQASAPSGAPDVYIPGVSAGNWVFALGNDWDNAIARTPVSGQLLVHQRVDTQSGDTYWVQSTTAPSIANALVDIHDTSPTTDQWNYATVEIVATHQ